MTISLSDQMKRFVETQAVEEGYASAGDYVDAVLKDALKRKGLNTLIAKLDEALTGGPSEPTTREDWDDLEREAIEGLRGESIRP